MRSRTFLNGFSSKKREVYERNLEIIKASENRFIKQLMLKGQVKTVSRDPCLTASPRTFCEQNAPRVSASLKMTVRVDDRRNFP